MSSTIFRDRDRDRDRWDDSRTTISSSNRGGGGYTTVKRYRIPAEDERSNFSDRRFSDRGGGERVEETRIVRREREREPERIERDVRIIRERDEAPRVEREVVIRRGREVEEAPVVERDLVIRRERTREDSRPEVRVDRFEERDIDRGYDRDYRYQRDYNTLSPSRNDPYELAKYSRSTEYFSRPEQPQPIIIREPPQQIIIQERQPIYIDRRDDHDYEVVKRSEVVEDRTVARREPEPAREEEYYYEKKVKEVGARDDEFTDRKSFRREVSPHDSVSQIGRDRDRDYGSDDSYEYIRKEKTESYDRDESPHHRRHIAEGAIAGIGAAELLRRHHKKEGQEQSGTLARVGKDVGAGVLGAVAATAVSRARSRHRSKSRRRRSSSSSSDSREGRRKSRNKHRSRSRSHSRIKKLGALGLGAAALGAIAIAARKNNQNKAAAAGNERRSRSRSRRHSVSGETDDARNPGHRKKRVAEAGLAGAAIAGLIERQRSKSRTRKGERSRSRLRNALPVIATGLGSAAVAGIYEKKKAKKEEAAAAEERRRSKSRSRSRSRSRSVYDGPVGAAASDPGLIEYGTDPLYGNAPATDYYGRPVGQPAYYSNAIVPTGAAAGAYAAGREDGQRERRRSSSSSSSDRGARRRRRHKSRSRSRSRSNSRSRDLATAGLAAGAGALAAHEITARRERKKAEKARRRYEAEHDPYEEGYDPAPYTPSPPPGAVPPQGYPPDAYYPSTNSFPPPPGAPAFTAQPAYNPAEYPPPPGAIPQAQYPQGSYSPPGGPPYAAGARRADENVSRSISPRSRTVLVDASTGAALADGLRTPTATAPPLQGPGFVPAPIPNTFAPYTHPNRPIAPLPSAPRASSQPPPTTKSVAFDISESEISSPDERRHARRSNERDRDHDRHRGYETDDSDSTLDDHHRSSHSTHSSSRDDSSIPSSSHHHRRHRHHDDRHRHSTSDAVASSSRSRDQLASPAPSDETVDLPERFDRDGRKKATKGDDPLADKFEEILESFGAGKGTSKALKSLFSGR